MASIEVIGLIATVFFGGGDPTGTEYVIMRHDGKGNWDLHLKEVQEGLQRPNTLKVPDSTITFAYQKAKSLTSAAGPSHITLTFQSEWDGLQVPRRTPDTPLIGRTTPSLEELGKNDNWDPAPIVTEKGGGQGSLIEGRYDLLPADAIALIAKVVYHGARKYGEGNWHPTEVNVHLNHALFHIFQYLRGSDDPSRELSHAACRLLFALQRFQWDKLEKDLSRLTEYEEVLKK